MTYYYKLEEIEHGGVHNWYGPVTVGEVSGSVNPTAVGLAEVKASSAGWLSLAGVIAAFAAAVVWGARRR